MTVVYNKMKGRYIALDDDQYICPRCKGAGFRSGYDWITAYHDGGVISYKICCYICEGKGYIDWIKNVMLIDWKHKDDMCNKIQLETREMMKELELCNRYYKKCKK